MARGRRRKFNLEYIFSLFRQELRLERGREQTREPEWRLVKGASLGRIV